MSASEIKWRRVSKDYKCPICKKDHWCTVSELGTCCMRVQNNKPMRNGGWLHPVGSKSVELPTPKPEAPTINTTKLIDGWMRSTTSELDGLARSINVSVQSLRDLHCAWAPEHRAFAFPMRDAYGDPCGIRLRNMAGNKWAVTGSRQGIFLPYIQPKSTVYICEGPTDTAATLSSGLFSIGRPSCTGGVDQLKTTVRRLGITQAIIVCDNDSPGANGAISLVAQLPVRTCLFVPPTKDIREFFRLGGTVELITSITNSLIWNVPQRTHQ